jgi:Domain of unknown function (DUF4157)
VIAPAIAHADHALDAEGSQSGSTRGAHDRGASRPERRLPRPRPSQVPVVVDDPALEAEANTAAGLRSAQRPLAYRDASPRVGAAVAAGGGVPLAAEVRDELEQRLGRDLGSVRVHSNAAADAAAADLDAAAFTSGRHLFFRSGRFAPQTRRGRRLLQHELTHAFQRPAVAEALGRPAVLTQTVATEEAIHTQSGTVQAEPPPPPLVTVDELNYAFFFTGGPYGESAREFLGRYYADHVQVAVSSFEEMFDRIWADTRQPPLPDHRRHVQEIVLVTHANAAGGMRISLTRGDLATPAAQRRFFTPWDLADLQSEFRRGLHRRFRQRRRELVGTVIDENTNVVVRGCNFGQSADAMDALRSLFGGHEPVWAPTVYQGYEVRTASSFPHHSPEEAYDFLVQQGYLPPELQPTPDEQKADYIRRVFGTGRGDFSIPAEFFVVDEETHAQLVRMMGEHRGTSAEAEPLKARDDVVVPSRGEHWALSEGTGTDPELDGLSSAELETRARALMNPYRPQNAAMLQRLRRAWEWRTSEEFARTGVLPGDPHDPLAGLPPENIFGDSNVIAGDAARYPGPRVRWPDTFETETLPYSRPTDSHADARTFVDPATGEAAEDTQLTIPTTTPRPVQDVPTSGTSSAAATTPHVGRGEGGAATTGPPARRPTREQIAQARDFGNKGRPASVQQREQEQHPVDESTPTTDPTLDAILNRQPQDGGHFWDILDLSMSGYSGLSGMPILADALEGTAIGVSMEIVGLLEPLISAVGLAVTIGDADDAQRVGAQRLGVRLGLEYALLRARGSGGRLSAGQLEAAVGNDPRLLAQITYSYPLGPDGVLEQFRIGLAAAAGAANAAMARAEAILRRRAAATGGSVDEASMAEAIEVARVDAVAQIYRGAVNRLTPRAASPAPE